VRSALGLALVLASALNAAASGDRPKVSRAQVMSAEKGMDSKLAAISIDDPVMVVGLTQGVYISGYGAVFISEVNLAPGPGISPFHQTISKDEVTRIHQKKIDRLPRLKQAMQEMLLQAAPALEPSPADEQVVLAISLFYWHWEDSSGLPAQVVMRAPRKTLTMVAAGKLDRSILMSAISVEEF
jgi:hypothetical protein